MIVNKHVSKANRNFIKYKTCEKKPQNMLYEADKETKELGFLGDDFCTQIKTCICKPNPTYAGFDLRMHPHGTRTQGCSKP